MAVPQSALQDYHVRPLSLCTLRRQSFINMNTPCDQIAVIKEKASSKINFNFKEAKPYFCT